MVYQGVPGGILGWQPTVERTTDLRRSQLTPDAIDQIDHSGKGSLDRAQQFVANLEAATTTTTTTTDDHHHDDDHHARPTTTDADHDDDGRSVIGVSTAGRKRRNTELGLGFLAVVVTIGGYILLALANGPTLPPDLGVLLAGIVVLYVIAHLAVRRLAPGADGTLLPLAAVLNGIGFVTIARIDRGLVDLGKATPTWRASSRSGARSASARSC